MAGAALKVLVLGGGPDREREVSLRSRAGVAAALRQAGHTVVEADVLPDSLDVLDTPCDVVFPVLHGRWGEGGPLQQIMESRRLRFVGAGSQAAAAAMDKIASKKVAQELGVTTAEHQRLGPDTPLTLRAPLVIKPLSDGSSFGVEICRSDDQVAAARQRAQGQFDALMAERFIDGREMTVGIVGEQVLPPIWIKPAAAFYDFDAKYDRNDTQYLFELALPEAVVEAMRRQAIAVHRGLGVRHLSRVDFIVDAQDRPWFLEINTLPGFTDHSLLPKAAAKAGMTMPAVCDKLVRLALES